MPNNPTLTVPDCRPGSLNDLGISDKLAYLEFQHTGLQSIVQTADQDVTNAADQDSNTLLFAVTAGQSYVVDGLLIFGGSAAANDAEFTLAVLAGTLTGSGSGVAPNAADGASALTLLRTAAAANTPQVPVGTFSASGSPVATRFEFAFNASNTTTFKVRFGNLVTAGGVVSRMMKGSFIRWKQIT